MSELITEYHENGNKYREYHTGTSGRHKRWYPGGELELDCCLIDGNLHGEYKSWFQNGQIAEHCFYEHGTRHSEHKLLSEQGVILAHHFATNGWDAYDAIKLVVEDIDNITEEEKTLIKLKWDIKCLP